MSIYEELQYLSRLARKTNQPAKVRIYNTALGELDRINSDGTRPDDKMAVKVLGKLISNSREMLKLRPELELEIELLDIFIPKIEMMSEDEIRNILESLDFSGLNNVGEAIKMGIKSLAGRPVENKLVANLVKEIYAKL